MASNRATHLDRNPFYVLGVPPTSTRAEIERQGQKLLAMLELGMAQAREYQTPRGPMPLDADLVRASMAELRDPERRILHELWAHLPPDHVVQSDAQNQRGEARREAAPRLPGARKALGFGGGR